MPRSHLNPDDYPSVQPLNKSRWQRWLLLGLVPPLLVLLGVYLLWNTFFHYVPPGKMLVIVAKSGADLPPGQVVADKGQKGIQREVLGEGWHFVMPYYYTTELWDVQTIGPREIGIVTSLGGVPPRDGRVLAEQDDEKGIRRQVLTPGTYRLNPYAYKIKSVPVTEIKPGFVGVLQRRLGKPSADRFADKPEEQGILRDVLHPGIYYINTEEYKVVHAEVGIDQTSYHAGPAKGDPGTAISFPTNDGFTIQMDCTIEWEVLPQDQPLLVAEYGDWHQLERNLLNQQVEKISRDRGFNYSVEDIIDGSKREAFQNDFTKELERVCREKNVMVRSAFIRNMIIPEDLLKQHRDRQLAIETKLTNKEREETAASDAEVEKEKKEVELAEGKFKAETDAKVVLIKRDIENLKSGTQYKIERMTSDYNARIAEKEADKKRVLGEAETDVARLKKTAESNIFKMKMDLFGNDGNAYLKYSMAEQLNKDLKLRVFHAGPGTFWTNLGDKNMNLMMSVPNGSDKAAADAKPVKDKDK
jgi:SPFH domain / Band 7 family